MPRAQSEGATVLDRVTEVCAAPGDAPELRLQQSLLVRSSLVTVVAGFVWGILYLAYDERLAGSIPLAYSALSLASTLVYLRGRRYEPYRVTQLALMLLLPFVLMLALGGFASSSAVILWSMLCPLGALIFARPRESPLWMLLYLMLVVLGGVVHPFLGGANALPAFLVDPAFFVLNIGAVSGLTFLLLYTFVRERNRAFALLRDEQARSEGLLLNILPKEVAAILKNERRTIADRYEEASVMFADMVGFTPLTAKLDPVEMVELLNEVFSYFDSLLDKYDVEKIRTIGDNYMVVAGLPRPRGDHAHALVRMALEMRDSLTTQVFRGGHRVSFRIGINSGALIAGVIGRRKFVYDVWGDAVNVASRMESHGAGGAIQITRATYERLRDDFACEYRGTLDVKGKGEMETWIVVSEKNGASGGGD